MEILSELNLDNVLTCYIIVSDPTEPLQGLMYGSSQK